MADSSKIEWTEATWNPVAGCTPVSPGCKNCYAARMARRLEAMGQAKYAGTAERRGSIDVFTGRINFDDEILSQPLHWRRPRRIFVNSMSGRVGSSGHAWFALLQSRGKHSRPRDDESRRQEEGRPSARRS